MDKLIEYMKAGTESLNENKYFIGITMILINIGARFIIDELDDDLRKIISNSFVRKFFIFCSVFMATRDIFSSFIITVIIIIIINEFLGKESEGPEENKKGESFNKQELDKAIQQLKTIQTTM